MKCLMIYKDVPYPPKESGSKDRAHLLLRMLKEMGIKTYCVFLDYGNTKPDCSKYLSQWCDFVEIVKIRKSLSRRTQETLNPGYPLFRPNYYDAKFEIAAKKLTLNNSFDFVVIGQDQMAIYFNLFDGIPIIFDPTDAWNLVIKTLIDYENNIIRRLYLKRQLKIIEGHIKKFYAIPNICLVVTKIDAENILKLNSRINVKILANSVDTNYFCPDECEEEKAISFHGVLNHKPNEDAVEWFCKYVLPYLKGINFYVIGRNPSRKIERLARKRPEIKLFPNVEDIRPYIRRSAIYVCPVRQGAGIKSKILEAMAMGKAIVATNFSAKSIQNAIESKSILVADTPNEFLTQISGLLLNPKERKSLSNRARNFVVQNFSFKKICNEFYLIIKQLVKL